MSALEKSKIQGLLDKGILRFYDRWVDDTFVRNKISDRDHISQVLHTFSPNLEFTVEIAKNIEENGRSLKFIPVLDIGVVWDPVGSWGYTKVYRQFRNVGYPPGSSTIRSTIPWGAFFISQIPLIIRTHFLKKTPLNFLPNGLYFFCRGPVPQRVR